MSTSIYYKDTEGTLHHIKADTNNGQEAREAVLNMLEVSKQAFLGQAVLSVVSGYQEPVLECA